MTVDQIVRKINPYLWFILLIIFCVFQYGIRKICGFTLYPDEFGYWASAAGAVGHDWSEVASMGSYYSFGYSLILIPVLLLFGGGVTAYRMAIAVNMFFLCAGMLLLKRLMKRIFPNISEIKNVFISGIAVMYPPWIFYMQMTLAESVLMFLFIVITYLLVCLIQKPSVITAILLAIAFIYSYSVHMRTIGVILAGIAVLVLWGLTRPAIRKHLLVFLAVLAIACGAVLFIKRNVVLNVFTYADAETLSVNDYGSQLWKIRQILSLTGFISLLVEIFAKIFYLGLSGFGIFYWTFLWSIKETVRILKRMIHKKPCYVQNYLAAFLFLSIMAEILISSIYMHGSVRIDCLIYGRYNEFLMPVIMAFGIANMYKSKHLLRGTLLAGGLPGLMIPVLISYIRAADMEGIRGYFVSGISYVLKESSFDATAFFWRAWILGFAFTVTAAAMVFISRKRKELSWLLGIVLTLEIILSLHISNHYTYRVNEIIYPDLIIAEKILEERNAQDQVLYLDEGASQFIDFQQMQMPELSIHVIEEERFLEDGHTGRFLIVYQDSKYQEQLDRSYDRKLISPSFILYYNEL